MGWSNITYLAARAQVNTFGEDVIFLYEDGTYSKVKAIITTKEENLKNNYGQIDGSGMVAAVFKAMTPEPYEVKKMIVREDLYRITTRKISDDGFNYFHLVLEEDDFWLSKFNPEGGLDAS